MNILLKPLSSVMPMAAAVLLPAAFLGAAMAPAAADGRDDAKTYTLFMGADISIGQDGGLHPVRDVSGSSWVVDVNGQPVLVSAKGGPISMKVTPLLKLTEDSVTISNLKGEGAYTFANDPNVRLTRSLNQAATLSASEAAAANQADALSLASISGAASSSSTPTMGISTTSSNLTPGSPGQGMTNGSTDLLYQGSWSNSAGFDALDVSFGISAGKRLEEPYIVVITRFHEKGADAGSFRDLIYAKALDPVGEKVANVKFEQAGFPPGYELKGFEIHVYDRGEEVATNVAPKRVTMTADEAFDYVKTAYLKAHKGDTLAAVPVMVGPLPADLRDRLAKGMYGGTFYVRVSADGLAGETYLDAACSKRIEDPYLESVVRGIRFKPALRNGAPVEGTYALNLGQLRI